MSSSNALATLGSINVPAIPVDDAAYTELAKGADFLGRLQLYTKGSAVNKKLIGPGEYGIPASAEDIHGLGDSVDLIPLARRPKAIDMSDTEAIVTNYDPASDEFKAIQAKAGESDSGCMYGISFLVIERTTGRLLEFFCGTKSTRSEAGKIYGFLPLSQENIDAMKARGDDVSKLKPHGPLSLTLKSKLVEKGKYSWHVPVVLPCSTPFTKLPSVEKINEEIVKFLTPKTEGVEKVEEPTGGKKRRAR